MTWIEPKIFIVAMRGIEMKDGKIILGMGVLGFLIVFFDLVLKRKRFVWAYGLVGFISSIVIGIIFFSYYRNQYNGGPGIFISALGAVQLTAAYVKFLFSARLPSSST